MTSKAPLHVLILGDQEAPEFAELRRSMTNDKRWRCHSTNSGSGSDTGARAWCHVVLLLAARPGRFSPADVQRIRAEHPLARLVQVVGPWCYGEGRTGPALEGVERIAWFEWPYRLPRLVDETAQLPQTATPQERVVAELADFHRAVIGGTVGVIAANNADFQMLASACRAFDRAAVWLTADRAAAERCVALVAICAGTDGPEFQATTQTFQAAGEVPKVVCLATPTLEDWHAAQAAGATAMLGQPFRLTDLAATLAVGLVPTA